MNLTIHEHLCRFLYILLILYRQALFHASYLQHLCFLSETIVLQNRLGPSSWIKFNVNETGFYRVNYPADVWNTFSSVLNTGDISV